jgi:hypothetical protein
MQVGCCEHHLLFTHYFTDDGIKAMSPLVCHQASYLHSFGVMQIAHMPAPSAMLSNARSLAAVFEKVCCSKAWLLVCAEGVPGVEGAVAAATALRERQKDAEEKLERLRKAIEGPPELEVGSPPPSVASNLGNLSQECLL